jgi:hypothetical protein
VSGRRREINVEKPLQTGHFKRAAVSFVIALDFRFLPNTTCESFHHRSYALDT